MGNNSVDFKNLICVCKKGKRRIIRLPKAGINMMMMRKIGIKVKSKSKKKNNGYSSFYKVKLPKHWKVLFCKGEYGNEEIYVTDDKKRKRIKIEIDIAYNGEILGKTEVYRRFYTVSESNRNKHAVYLKDRLNSDFKFIICMCEVKNQEYSEKDLQDVEKPWKNLPEDDREQYCSSSAMAQLMSLFPNCTDVDDWDDTNALCQIEEYIKEYTQKNRQN